MTDASIAARRRVLAATSISYVVVVLDTSIVNVTLDSLSAAFDTHVEGLQWVVSAYTLMFASLLLSGGMLGDRWGARRIYLAGLLLFTAASLVCAMAGMLPVLVLARAVQGIGAAMLVPCSLKLIRQAYPDASERARAIGLWVGLGGVAMAVGPLIGGVLIHSYGWRSIFVVNVPICLAGVFMAWRIRADAASAQRGRVDLAGQLCAMVALASLIAVTIEGQGRGWTSAPIIAGALIALFAGLAFLRIESRHAHPMLPLFLFRNGVFFGSTCVSMASAFVFYGLFFVISLDFQQAHAYSPLQTGLALLPMTAMVAAGSLLAGRLARRWGVAWPMKLAFAGYGAGAIGLWLAAGSAHYVSIIAPMLAIGFASGFISPAATAPALDTVTPHRSGVAAAALNSARQVGAAMGVAVFGAMVGATHSFQTGLRAALVLAVIVSLAAMPVWGRALRAPRPHDMTSA